MAVAIVRVHLVHFDKCRLSARWPLTLRSSQLHQHHLLLLLKLKADQSNLILILLSHGGKKVELTWAVQEGCAVRAQDCTFLTTAKQCCCVLNCIVHLLMLELFTVLTCFTYIVVTTSQCSSCTHAAVLSFLTVHICLLNTEFGKRSFNCLAVTLLK